MSKDKHGIQIGGDVRAPEAKSLPKQLAVNGGKGKSLPGKSTSASQASSSKRKKN